MDSSAVQLLEKTFRAIVSSRRSNAGDVLGFAVLNSTGSTQRMAVEAVFERAERPGLEAVLRVFDRLPPELQERALESADLFLPVLRQNVRERDRQVRVNICDFLVRMQDTRVAHILADLLQDTIEEIKKRAQDGLLSLAHTYHLLAFDIENGKADIPRAALETKRYALLDALLTALRFYSSHERPQMIAVLFSLDRRGDEVLLDILVNPMDRRRKIILDILETVCYPRAIRFLLSMIKSGKTASLAHEVIETRFDMDFIKALLSERVLLGNTRVREALSGVDFVPWLRPGTEKASKLPDRLAVRAIRFLLLTGTSVGEQEVILARLAALKRVAPASAARFVLTALSKQVGRDRIDAGLVKIEDRCGPLDAEPWEPAIADLVPERPRGAVRSDLMPEESQFRNFMNSFESLARSEKEATMADFRAKGLLQRETRRALRDSEAEIVLRAIRVVEYAGCQADVSKELASLTSHPDTRVRSSAVRQLGKAGAYDAMKALFGTLNDRDRRVLANAVEALEETGHRQILRLLHPLMKHPDNRVRGNAAKATWTLGEESGRTTLADMLKSPRAEMRLSGLWGLRQIGIDKESALVKALAKDDPDEKVRNSAEMTLLTWEGGQ